MNKKPIVLAIAVTISEYAHANSERLVNPANNHAYQRLDSELDWHTAKTVCSNMGAHLATITSQAENNWISDNFATGVYGFFLGGTDEGHEGNWNWITNEPWSYTNWNSGEPNNSGGENYLNMWGGSSDATIGTWNDTNESVYTYLCEWEPDSTINVYNNDFNTSAGAEWTDSTIATSNNGEKFLGASADGFGAGSNTLTLNNLPAHTKVKVDFDLYIIKSWNGNGVPNWSGPDNWQLTADGNNLLFTNFGSDSSQAYPNQLSPYGSGGFFDAYTGVYEVTHLGFVSMNATYRLSYTFVHTATSVALKFTSMQDEAADNEGWGLDNVRVSVNVAEFPLNISKQGTGNGTVTSNPTGINCGNDCSENFAQDTAVTLTATPTAGSTFAGWGGVCSGTATTCTVTMDADKSATATFNLAVIAPTVTSNAATAITATSATLNGSVISNGATTTVSFDFGTTTSYGTSVAASPVSVYSATAVAVTANKTGLICNTTYNYRVKAVNSAGTSLGANRSFKTSACPVTAPVANTSLAETVTATGATLVGQVTPKGAVTTVTFELGKTESYGLSLPASQSPLAATAANTKVTYTAGGLDCNTKYNYRVKAVNSAGTSYGINTAFKTLACLKTPRAILIGGGTVAGDPVGNAGISSQLGFTYTVLKKQGFNLDGSGRDEIKILGNPNLLTVNFNGTAIPVQSVRSSDFAAGTALTQWVQGAERLIVYLIGHGEVGYFDLDQTTGERLTATALDAWLDLVQPSLTNITVVDESCHSGSFLPTLAEPPLSVGVPKRVLVASAATDQLAAFMANGRISYSQTFWLNILAGRNLKESHYQALLWLDNRFGNPQVPQLEADGNAATANNDSADLQLVSNFCLGFTMNNGILTANQCVPVLASIPEIQSVAAAQTLNGVRIANLELTAATGTGISSAWAIIKRPDYQIDYTQTFVSQPTVALTQDAANPARWIGRYAPGDLGIDGVMQRGLDVQGEYKFDYYVASTDGAVPASKSSTVTQNVGLLPFYTTPALFYVDKNQLQFPIAQLWNTGLSRSLFTRANATSPFQLTNTLVSLTNSDIGTVISNINPPRWNVGSTGSPSVVNIPQLIKSGDTQIYHGTLKRENAIGTESQWTFSLNTMNYLCGDADSNGVVNIVDALAVARAIVGLPPPPAVNDTADVDSNGQIVIDDALNIAKFVVGLAVSGTCLN